MSLINKMLQDLDARGPSQGEAAPVDIRPSAARERELPLRAAAIVICFVILLAIAAVFAWRHFAPVPKIAPLAAAPVLPPPAAPIRPAVAPPVVASAVTPAITPATPILPTSPIVPSPSVPMAPSPPAPIASAVAPVVPSAVKPAADASRSAHPQPLVQPARLAGGDSEAAPAASKAEPLHARATRASALAPLAGTASSALSVSAPSTKESATKEVASPQRAENEYRRALDALQEGRMVEALTGLQQTLLIDPRHQAARETLVRLLLEANRTDEAARELDQGLLLDPQQPTQAMLLARLQLEKGGPAIDTLMRTLPFAAGNGDYQAFLAGVLQRAQRNKESAEHYQIALKKAPQNGVWWMGLGIALQADKRVPEARDAFEHAKAATNLTPELQTFVERKLQQLTH